MTFETRATEAPAFGKRGVRVAQRPVARPTEAPAAVAVDEIDDGHRLIGAIPLLTFGMAIGLTLIFGLEQYFAFDVGPGAALSPESLIALGAASHDRVFGHGEFWRLLLAPLLHASSSHLAGNCVAMAMVGFRLEPLIGRGWFALIFAASALAGVAGSMIGNDPMTTTVGASGAITGLVAAGLFMSFHERADAEDGYKMRRRALFLLVPALLPLFLGVRDHVDYHAHLGGAFAGAVIALGLIVTWNGDSFRPRGAIAAAKIAMCLGVAAMAAGLCIIPRYGEEAAIARTVMPDSLAARPMDELAARSADLMARYPDDPRAALIRAVALLQARQPQLAESILRKTMTMAWPARPFAAPFVRERAQALLALALGIEWRFVEASALAREICADPRRSESRAMLVKAKLCRA
jgi:membrane associated rhomboid family serine protease